MNVQMSYLESGKRQQWKFEASTYQPVKDGKYTLRSSKESEYTIDVANALKWMVRMYGCIIIMARSHSGLIFPMWEKDIIKLLPSIREKH